MRTFKSILLLLIVVICLNMCGCKNGNIEDTAIPDVEVAGEEKDQQPEKEQPQAEAEEQQTQPEQVQPEKPEEEPSVKEETKTEKKYLSIDSTKAQLSKEELLDKGQLVVKVRILSKAAEEMANPDGKAVDSTGAAIDNRLVTSYTAEVLEVYKGNYTQHTIVVKTAEGRGLSPDLILYGEDEKYILATPLTRFSLVTAKEYVLVLVDNKGENAVMTGYFIYGPEIGSFSVDEKGVWNNKEPISDIVFTEKNIQSEIASIVSEEKE